MSRLNSGLNIIVLSDDAERFRGALTIAIADNALGRSARIFLQLDAVRLLAPPPIKAAQDDAHNANGLPSLSVLLDEALECGVIIIACQSGLALAGLCASDIDPRIEAGGPISFLKSVESDDRLLSV